MVGVNRASDKLKKMREMFWSGRPDLNRGPPAPKVNSKMLSSCLVYVFRASYIMVYGGIRRLLFPNVPNFGLATESKEQQTLAIVTRIIVFLRF